MVRYPILIVVSLRRISIFCVHTHRSYLFFFFRKKKKKLMMFYCAICPDSLKCIAWKGRALVIGFAAGTIEKVK